MKPKVSVIIPTYNREKYIGPCIDSVLNQDDPGFKYEVIVVDDGSTDDTAKLVASYGNQVTYLALAHSGKPAVARNAGLKIAKGEFIAFQDSDDLWTKDKLKSQLAAFADPEVVAEYANAEYIDEGGKRSGRPLLKPGRARFGDVFDEMISKTKQPLPAITMVVRASALKKIGGFNERMVLATDTECWIRLAAIGHFAYTDKILGFVRRGGDNISSIPEEGDWLDSIFKHAANRVTMYKEVLADPAKILKPEHQQKLAAALADLYEYLAVISKKLAYETADAYRSHYGRLPRARLHYFLTSKRSLYFTSALRLIRRLSPGLHRQLVAYQRKLRTSRS